LGDTLSSRLQIVIADDHPLMLAGVRQALEEEGDLEVVGEARTGSQVLPLVGRTNPDVVLLDIRMPEMDGLTCLELIRRHHRNTKVVILSVFSEPEQIQLALRKGASGYIVKSVNPRDLASAIRQAVDGTVFHPIALLEPEEVTAKEAGLTEREIAILKALAKGLSNQEIGKQLWVTEQTVKFHLTNIYRKLNVANRTEAARYAYRHGLVEARSTGAFR
jgi:DNA-binding NarL/FixJ family response regulator